MKRLTITILCLISFLMAEAQKVNIAGFVSDAKTKESIIGANVFLEDRSVGVSTDQKGYFNLWVELPATVCVSCIGYADTCILISESNSDLMKIRLKPSVQTLQTVEVKAKKTERPQFNTLTLAQKDIELLPTIGSRPDIIKAAQQLPGIEPLTEASSVMLVRGGNPGENLYMLDNVPLIYVNHVGGFMSVFNPEMINSMDIYKGGFPARFGGKLSSIVDLTAKKGDPTRLKGSLSAGLTDLAFSVEGPGGLKNSSFIFTGRKTLTELLLYAASEISKNSGAQDNNIIYGFHDFDAKYTWSPDAKNSFALNIYEGDDYMRIWKNTDKFQTIEKNSVTNIWGNFLVSGQWNSAINQKLLATNTLSYTRYHLKNQMKAFVQSAHDTVNFKSQGISTVQDLSLRSQWKAALLQGLSLEFGLQASYLRYLPSYYYNTYTAIMPKADFANVSDNAVYLDNNFKIGKHIDGTLGARLDLYLNQGFKHLAFEPRLNINFRLGESTLNLTAMHVAQNSHLLMTPGSIMNNEIWIPADAHIKPSESNQFSLGWQRGFADGRILLEADAYYKTLNDLVTYRDGYTCLIGESDWRSKVETGGKGQSYGLELMAKANFGRLNGYLGYTYSHTTRQFDGINGGKTYLYEYDRPHSINLNANYMLSEKWSLSASWTYQTGLPYTPLIATQYIPYLDGNGNLGFEESHIYGERNSARMKPYHRLDIAAKWKTKTEKGRNAEWTFSIYNAYCRQNPYYYYYGDKIGDPISWGQFPNDPPQLWQRCFFPIIPSFSYKVWF